MPTKTYQAYLIIDYRDDEIRLRKTQPSKSERAPTEYPVKVEVTVDVPEMEVPVIEAEYNVPEPKVREAIEEDFLSSEFDEEYDDVIQSVVEDNIDLITAIPQPDNTVHYETVVDALAPQVTTRAEGYPDPDDIKPKLRTRIDLFLENNESEGGVDYET